MFLPHLTADNTEYLKMVQVCCKIVHAAAFAAFCKQDMY